MIRIRNTRACAMLAGMMLLAACGGGDRPATPARPALPPLPPAPVFNADSAYAFVQMQVDFGPRVPGTDAHRACADRMVAMLQGYGAEVIEQTAQVTIYTGQKLPMRNIFARFHPDRKERILLLAHYDTRPFADRDTDRKHEPIDGANDGGSGVGVLLEIARHLAAKEHGPGVDILLTDVEDHGTPTGSMGLDQGSIDTWALGAQYFAKNPPVPGYTARFGILLDMVGARDATFMREAISMQYAPAVVHKVWKLAGELGHGRFFRNENKYFVGTDDHVPINRDLGIPTIDIIEYDASTQAFGPYWHTHDDNMDVIDRETLQAVGHTVIETVWRER
ncbi:MAG: M28 family peptidase [Flavobacteriales bacterium]|nr:M28 family peptidase [Flavobacteriales bacterium]